MECFDLSPVLRYSLINVEQEKVGTVQALGLAT
jgi:hypothetical protein